MLELNKLQSQHNFLFCLKNKKKKKFKSAFYFNKQKCVMNIDLVALSHAFRLYFFLFLSIQSYIWYFRVKNWLKCKLLLPISILGSCQREYLWIWNSNLCLMSSKPWKSIFCQQLRIGHFIIELSLSISNNFQMINIDGQPFFSPTHWIDYIICTI